jgi:hypothetical protein
VQTGAGAEATAERNRFLLAQLAAQRLEAEADLSTLATPRPEDVALAQSRVAAAEAALAKARADAELARVRAPMEGTILRIFARPGDQVGSDGLMEMADLSRLDVVADVFETDLAACARVRRPRSSSPARRSATRPPCARSAGRCAAPPRPAPTPSPRWIRARWRCASPSPTRRPRCCAGAPTCRSRWRSSPWRAGTGGGAMNELSPPRRLHPWAPELTGEAAPPPASRRRSPGLLDALRLPLRLAARQLRADRAKLATAIAA